MVDELLHLTIQIVTNPTGTPNTPAEMALMPNHWYEAIGAVTPRKSRKNGYVTAM